MRRPNTRTETLLAIVATYAAAALMIFARLINNQ